MLMLSARRLRAVAPTCVIEQLPSMAFQAAICRVVPATLKHRRSEQESAEIRSPGTPEENPQGSYQGVALRYELT